MLALGAVGGLCLKLDAEALRRAWRRMQLVRAAAGHGAVAAAAACLDGQRAMAQCDPSWGLQGCWDWSGERVQAGSGRLVGHHHGLGYPESLCTAAWR